MSDGAITFDGKRGRRLDRTANIDQDTVDVWLIDLDLESRAGLDASWLSDEERKIATDRKTHVLRSRYIAAHVATRMILAGYLDRDPREIVFTTGGNGKPELEYQDLHVGFNLSHCDDVAALAVGPGRDIGIDVERIRRVPGCLDIAQTFFSASEAARLAALPDSQLDHAFHICWTRKEAMLKATGAGLQGLPYATVAVEPAALSWILDDDGEPRPDWSTFSFEPRPGFVGSAAARRRHAKWVLREFARPAPSNCASSSR